MLKIEDREFDLAIDFGWFYPDQAVFLCDFWLFGVFGNFGLAIIGFTIIVFVVVPAGQQIL